jgi:hypothetical protein
MEVVIVRRGLSLLHLPAMQYIKYKHEKPRLLVLAAGLLKLHCFVRAIVEREQLRLNDFAALDAARADANALVATLDLRLNRAQIHAPAATGDVVRMRNVVSELRSFATDIADLSHDLLQLFELFAQTRP